MAVKRSRAYRRTLWWRTYATRIARGLEYCRNCGDHWPGITLEFAHLRAHIFGGRSVFANTTILCTFCNNMQGTRVWGHLVSLEAEEASALPELRWAALAWRSVSEVQALRTAECQGSHGHLDAPVD